MQRYEELDVDEDAKWLDSICEAALYLSICFIILGVFLPAIFKPGFIVGWGQEVLSVADIFSGLWRNGDYVLSGIVFTFSVIFPIIKTILAAVAFRGGRKVREFITPPLQMVSKWSMLDVFLIAVTIVFVKSFASFSLEPRIGLYLFAFGVILNNLASSRLSYVR